MRASTAHSLIVTGLSDPERLREWALDPASLERMGIDPSQVDLGALADFAGLSEKVRHNLCREDLPLTFRILSLSGLEIDLFRYYVPTSLERRRRGLNVLRDRLEGLANFVEQWAPAADPARTLARDVLRHEHSIAVLRSDARQAEPVPAGPNVPSRRGRTLIWRMTCDPRQVDVVLRARQPDLGTIVRGPRTLVYQRELGAAIRIFEVEDAVGDLLEAVDGRSTVRDIALRLLGDGAGDAAGALAAALAQMRQAGLVSWGHGGGASACA